MPRTHEMPPEVVAFIKRNPWFAERRAFQFYAIGLLDEVAMESPLMPLVDQLALVEERARREIPQLSKGKTNGTRV